MAKKRNLKIWVVMAVLLAAMAPAIAAGGTIYVDADASPGGDGTTWATAYKYLQDALHKPPTSGDEIWVAEGTHKPDASSANPGGTGSRTATFQLINGVSIKGGYAGVGAGDPNERDVEAYETILSGDLNGDDAGFTNNGENSYHVVTGSGTNSTAVLDGFTITGGNANGSWPYYVGGGMFNYENSSPTVTNCTFSGNWAMSTGGGMFNSESSPTVTNCTFSGNSASWGGGMFNQVNSSPMVTNCTFSGNSAGDYGGGMYNYVRSSPTLTNCTFTSNGADDGGGMYNDGSNPTVTNCIFWGNSGGQIYNDESTPTVTYSDVAGGYSGTGNINADPCFVDADGPDNIVGTEDDNLRLSAGSPCIDAGDNTAVPGGVTTDLDGSPRFVDDPETADTGNGTPPIVDLGAYEYYREPVTIYVDAYASGANDGLSWANAYNYLQDALTDANASGDDIWVAQGIYKPDANTANPGGTGDRTATFQLINGVAIYGGFAGFGAPDPNARDWQTNETILSGDLNGDDVGFTNNGENSYHVVTGSGTNATAILDGFTITVGNANGSYPDSSGGGIYCYNSSPTIANCTISGNSASYDGGGILCEDYSSATITNCTISGNSANIYGGGISCWGYSSPTIANCTISGNSADKGGGICCEFSSSPTITNCTISGNQAGLYGGGIWCYESSPTITNCTISGNSASTFGGGIYCHVSSPTITNCTISGNSANYGGGIFCWPNSTPTITNCTISGNSAIGHGGGICCEISSSPTITNCTISGNSANHGGGICCEFSSSPTITNCILWANAAPTGHEIALTSTAYPSTLTVRYSDIQGGAAEAYVESGCTLDLDGTNIDADPLFVRGALHRYYLSQMASYESIESPCVDMGSDTAANLGLDDLSTRSDGMDDEGLVDMGYHAPYALWNYSITRGSDDITIRWNALPGVSYTVQHSIDMEAWTDVPVGETDTWTDVGVSETTKFYRVFEQ